MRPAVRLLKDAAKQAAKQAEPVSSDPWLYDVGSASPFWDKVRRALVNNPDSVSGILKQDYRTPPGSRLEPYAKPASKASDIAQNSYYLRDFRRAYPRTSVVTQIELAGLLLSQPEQLKLPTPAQPTASTSATPETALTLAQTATLSSLFVPADTAANAKPPAGKTYGAGNLPPRPPLFGVKYEARLSEDQPSCVQPGDLDYPVRYFT